MLAWRWSIGVANAGLALIRAGSDAILVLFLELGRRQLCDGKFALRFLNIKTANLLKLNVKLVEYAFQTLAV